MLNQDIMHFIRDDLPKPLDSYLLNHPQDHRLLAAYYAKALGLDPLSSAIYLVRVIDRLSRTGSCLPVYKNTGSTRNYRCILCGAIVGSFCPKWKRTIQSQREVDNHEAYERKCIAWFMGLLGSVKPKLSMLRCCVTS